MKSDKNENMNRDDVEQRVKDLLGRMSLKEKVALLGGKGSFDTMPIERLGIPSLVMTDGPHGVRINLSDSRDRLYGHTTAFPTGISMASSWNPGLIEKVGAALGEETRAMGCDILLGPCVNIIRHPLAGRNFEAFSEDPFLTGQIATSYIKGVQSRNAGACIKHFACNNQETERFRGSSVVDERTLREIYLPAFEAAVKEAGPWGVMSAYNRINGIYASENSHLLNEILKEEWGFKGAVISDWGGTHSIIELIKGGLDLEMPGPSRYMKELADAAGNWQIDEEVINRSAARILRLIILSGKMDNPAMPSKYPVNTPEHHKLVRELAEESMILLKNDNGILPLKKDKIKSIAVIGPNAADLQISGEGSSRVGNTMYCVAPLAALKERLGKEIEVRYEEGCTNYEEPYILSEKYLIPSKGEGKGLWAEYFDNTEFLGEPVLSRVEYYMSMGWGKCCPVPGTEIKQFSARWTGKLVVENTGNYTMKVRHCDIVRIYIDEKLILESRRDNNSKRSEILDSARIDLTDKKAYDIRIEFIKPEAESHASMQLLFGVSPGSEMAEAFNRAVELAGNSDIAVIFAGYGGYSNVGSGFESEGVDRTSLDLPGRQNELISKIAEANLRTIVVLNSGAPVTMPWLDRVCAVLQAQYCGMEGGNAIADILLGVVNPSGKLSVTYPVRIEDTPAFINFPGTKEVLYGEGIFTGYRYYDKRDIETLFPFGFGLSYTTFEYSGIKVPRTAKAGEQVKVTVTVKNTGHYEGKEVVQLYVRDCESSFARPTKELKGFQKLDLKPGENRTIDFMLDDRAFAFYNPYLRQWVVEPGEFEILAGSSLRDIRLKEIIVMDI